MSSYKPPYSITSKMVNLIAYREFESYKYNSLNDLLKAHKILMKDILKTAGSFRSVNVGVGSKEE